MTNICDEQTLPARRASVATSTLWRPAVVVVRRPEGMPDDDEVELYFGVALQQHGQMFAWDGTGAQDAAFVHYAGLSVEAKWGWAQASKRLLQEQAAAEVRREALAALAVDSPGRSPGGVMGPSGAVAGGHQRELGLPLLLEPLTFAAVMRLDPAAGAQVRAPLKPLEGREGGERREGGREGGRA